MPTALELYAAEVCADGNCTSPDDINTVRFNIDGPGMVDFGDKNVVKTWARFSEPGIRRPDSKKEHRIYNPHVFPVIIGCSILFSLKIFIKNGFFSKKLMFTCGQSEEN